MKIHTQILSWTIIGAIMASHTFAFAMPITAVPVSEPTILPISSNQSSDEYIPPVNMNNTTYEFDTSAIKSEKPGLYKVVCDNAALYKRFGIDNGKNFTALEYKEGDYVFRGDFRSCSFSAWKEEDMGSIDWKKNRITEAEALTKAAAFLSANKIEELTFKLGTPIVTAKMTESPVLYSSEAGASADAKVAATETAKKDDGKYISVSIVYPIVLGGKIMRTSWDDPVGVSITVDGRGVITNLNATTKFTLKKRTSDLMTDAELVSYIKKGGNNGYYAPNGGASTVKLDTIEKTFVLFTYYAKGVSDQYISTGYRLESSATKLPYNDIKNYSQIISNYVIGNPSFTPYVK